MSQRVPWETLSATAFVLSCAVAASIVSFAQSAEQLTSETTRSTSAGATFTAPAAWTIRSDGNKIVLTPPETDSHLVIVDVKAPDAASAVTALLKSAFRCATSTSDTDPAAATLKLITKTGKGDRRV